MKEPTSSAVGVEKVGWIVVGFESDENSDEGVPDALWVDFLPVKASQMPILAIYQKKEMDRDATLVDGTERR